MDSQHRHELAENELAHWLEDALDQIKPYFTLIVLGVIGLIAIVAAYGYYSDSTHSNRAAEWSQFTTATMEGPPSIRVLESVSSELDGSGAPADWASITWAEGKLYEASEQVLSARPTANEAIQASRDEFERLLVTKGVQPIIRDRAQLGVARSYELEGDFPKAIDAYKKTTGAYASIAAARAAELERPEVKDDLGWIATAEAPASSALAMPDARPEFSPDDLGLEPAGEAAEPAIDVTLEDLLQGYEKQDAIEAPADEQPAEGEEAATGDAETGEEASESAPRSTDVEDGEAPDDSGESTADDADADADADADETPAE